MIRNVKLGTIANVVALFAAFASGYYWIENKFETLVNEQVVPFKKTTYRYRGDRIGNHDHAVRVFSESIKAVENDRLPKTSLLKLWILD